MNKKMHKKKRRRVLLFGTLSIISIIVCLYTIISSTHRVYVLEKEQKNLILKIEELKKEEEQLKMEASRLEDKEYIGRYAREEYSYSGSNEYILKFQKNNEKIVEEQKFNKMYTTVIGVIVLIIMIILIIKKLIFKEVEEKTK